MGRYRKAPAIVGATSGTSQNKNKPMKAVLTIECETINELVDVITSLPPLASELVALKEIRVKEEKEKHQTSEKEPIVWTEKAPIIEDKKKELYHRICQNPDCKESFTTSRVDKLFCSSRCYQKEWQRKKKLTKNQ